MNPGLRARSHRESAARSLGRLCGPRAAALLSPKAELARGVSTLSEVPQEGRHAVADRVAVPTAGPLPRGDGPAGACGPRAP